MICHINLAKGYRGGERQTEILVKKLSKRGFKQKLFVRKNSKLLNRFNKTKNLEIIELSKPFVLHVNKFKECKLIHAHEKKAEQLAFFVNLFLKKPYFITRRVDIAPKNNLFNQRIYKKAKKVFVLSNMINKIMIKNFNVTTKIIPSVSSNLKKTVLFQDLKNKYLNKFIVLNIGALFHHHKGQLYILQAAKELKNLKDIYFLLVGEGEDRKKYEEFIKKHKLDNVELVGFKENVGDYLAIADIFLFPSLQEGLGSVLIDAMEFGIPIIASNRGGIPDLIKDNYNGLLIDVNKDEIVNNILRLYKDEKLRKRLAANAKKESEKYKIENLVDEYISEYKEFL